MKRVSVMAVVAASALIWSSAAAWAQPYLRATTVSCGTALSSIHPNAGSTVYLERGCTYNGTLTINANSVTVTATGSGAAPIITIDTDGATIDIYGSHDVIENLSLVGVAPGTWVCGGQLTPAGHGDGVDLEAGALNNTITSITATGFYAAVYAMTGANTNTIKNSTFTSNLQLDTNTPSGSAGAFGVLLWGNHNTVNNNTISDNQACSLAYGHDGSAVEVYGGSDNTISNNHASNDSAFTELGNYSGNVATGNNFTGNNVSDGSNTLGMDFLITRGSGDPDGPVFNTTASRNTVNLTFAGDQGAVSYAWQSGDGTLLTLTNNYINVGTNQALYEDGGYVNGGGNTFIGTCNPSSAC